MQVDDPHSASGEAVQETRRLAQFVAETGYHDLPQTVVESVKVYILDNLASGFVGSATPWADMVGRVALESAPSGPCSVFARDWTTSPSYVTLVNGTMIGGVVWDHAFLAGAGDSLWETQEEADRASSPDHVQALRSNFHNLVEAGHIEQLVEISGANHNIPHR